MIGATCDEVRRRFGWVNTSTCSARQTDLKRGGYITALRYPDGSEIERQTGADAPAVVYVATQAGIDAIEKQLEIRIPLNDSTANFHGGVNTSVRAYQVNAPHRPSQLRKMLADYVAHTPRGSPKKPKDWDIVFPDG